jgi:hypothetical protein
MTDLPPPPPQNIAQEGQVNSSGKQGDLVGYEDTDLAFSDGMRPFAPYQQGESESVGPTPPEKTISADEMQSLVGENKYDDLKDNQGYTLLFEEQVDGSYSIYYTEYNEGWDEWNTHKVLGDVEIPVEFMGEEATANNQGLIHTTWGPDNIAFHETNNSVFKDGSFPDVDILEIRIPSGTIGGGELNEGDLYLVAFNGESGISEPIPLPQEYQEVVVDQDELQVINLASKGLSRTFVFGVDGSLYELKYLGQSDTWEWGWEKLAADTGVLSRDNTEAQIDFTRDRDYNEGSTAAVFVRGTERYHFLHFTYCIDGNACQLEVVGPDGVNIFSSPQGDMVKHLIELSDEVGFNIEARTNDNWGNVSLKIEYPDLNP